MTYKKIAVEMPIKAIRKTLSTAIQQLAFECGFDWSMDKKEVYGAETFEVLIFNQEDKTISWVSAKSPGYVYCDYNNALEWLIGCKEEAEQPAFKVGDWICDYYYPGNKYIVRIEEIIRKNNDNWWSIQASGINGDNEILANDRTCGTAGCRLATTEEIQTHLIAEAKKRGYVNAILAKTGINKEWRIPLGKIAGFVYVPQRDILECKGNGYAYQQGQWAEILKEEEIKIAGYTAKFDNDNYNNKSVSFGCKKYTKPAIASLYDNCLIFGIQSVTLSNCTVSFDSIKKVHQILSKL